MLMPSRGVRILVATKPVDFRKGHDGLAPLVQSTLAEDPFTGTVFVFRAKRADRMKILFWDGSGLVMAYKRLEESSFAWPAIRDGAMTLNRAQYGTKVRHAVLAYCNGRTPTLIRKSDVILFRTSVSVNPALG